MSHRTLPVTVEAVRVRDRLEDKCPDWVKDLDLADVGTKGAVQLSRLREPHPQTLGAGDWLVRLSSGRVIGMENQDFESLFEAAPADKPTGEPIGETSE